MEISTIGLDLAKSIFQVHAVDTSGEIVVRKALRRAQVLPFFTKLPPCLIAWRRAARRIVGRASW
jgi:transposase